MDEIEIKDKSSKQYFIKIEKFRKHIRKTKPNKHGAYFELVYLQKGAGIHQIDFHTYTIQAPQIFCINKEQVHY